MSSYYCMKTELARTSLAFKNYNLPSQNNQVGDRDRTHFMVHEKAINYILNKKLHLSLYLYCRKWIMIDFSLSNCYIINYASTLIVPKRLSNQIFCLLVCLNHECELLCINYLKYKNFVNHEGKG